GRWLAGFVSRLLTRACGACHAPYPERPRRELGLRRARLALVARAEGEAGAAALARRAAGPEGPGDRRAGRGDRRLRARPRPGRPGVDRGAREGHPARREGTDREIGRAHV